MKSSASRVTFIVRLWTDGDAAEGPSWRGVAERIGSEERCGFQTLDELLNWLSRELAQTQ